MEHVRLSNGLDVSRVCLGAMMFGTTTPKDEAFRMLDAFTDMGGSFIDTSNNYAHWAGTGDESETLLGEWISSRRCRDRIVLATKVGFDRKGSGAGLKRGQIEYWIDESLRKLRTDHVDLYYAHTDDPDTPVEETAEAFDSLVRKGKVRFLGGSNYDTWRFCEYNSLAKEKGYAGFTVMQQRFTYLDCRFEIKPAYIFNENTGRERLRYLEAKDIPLVAYSCLIKGGYGDPARIPENYIAGKKYDLLTEMAAAKGISRSALAVAWMCGVNRLKGYPLIIPLFSSSRTDHFIESCLGAGISLTDEELKLMTES